ALHETGYGTSSGVVDKNNPGGLMDPATDWQTLQHFPTLKDGLEAMADTLYNRIIGDGLVTIEQLGEVYAPIDAKNDPDNLNKHWIPTMKKLTANLGGLTMNCEVVDRGDMEKSGVNLGYPLIPKPSLPVLVIAQGVEIVQHFMLG